MTTIDRRLPPGFLAASLRADARAGLTATPKSLPPKWFYDANGSSLFEKITELPEYYPTRAERAILLAQAGQIAAATGAAALAADYPGLDVRAVLSDFEEHLGLPSPGEAPGPRLLAFLGSTIGNLMPLQRAAFLARIRAQLGPGDFFLLGTDLVKDPAVLVAAYDDSAGVTAEFNKNVLAVLNASLGADFDPDLFEHVALWDAEAEWIEMRLRSLANQTVRLPSLDLTINFTAGEEMRTEVSAKFRRDGVAAELAAAGFWLVSWWTDPQAQFALSLSQ